VASKEARGLRRLLGRSLRRCRRELGLSQEDVAERLKMVPRQYQKLEACETDINLRTLARLARVFRVKAADLLR